MTAALVAMGLSAAAGWLLTGGAPVSRRLGALSTPRGLSGAHGTARADADRRVRARQAFDRVRGRWRRAGELRRRRAGVRELCFALAEELRAGRTPAEGLQRSVEVLGAGLAGEWAGVVAAARTGGDVPAALRSAGGREGAEGLRRLGACWQVSAGSGARFAVAVERLAGALRSEEEHRLEVATHLAGTRSTTRLLAFLPLIGLGMSAAMGMEPFGFLFGTPYGLACLGAGAVLDALGVLWTGQLARRAVEPE